MKTAGDWVKGRSQSMFLTFIQAKDGDTEKVLYFYEELIDKMHGAKYAPLWTKNVYPALTDLQTAIEEETLYYAVNDHIIGAFIVNTKQGDGYEKVSWKINASSEQVAVLHLLAVSPDEQGKGLGRRMLNKAEEIAVDHGCSVMRLDTLTWNVPGHKLYERAGFYCCGEVELTYASTGTIPFRMYEKNLTDNAEHLT